MAIGDLIRRLRDRRTERALAPLGGGPGVQPWTHIIWPPPGANASTAWPTVYDQITAYQLPGVARAIQLIEGMIKQMPMNDFRGHQLITPRPSFLASPDPRPEWPRSRFVAQNIVDYEFNGNAISLITARNSESLPSASTWVPAAWVSVTQTGEPYPFDILYSVDGVVLPRRDVVHVARGADPTFPARGVGVVEQHVRTLRKAAAQEDYELSSLADGAVPSIAVISNNRNSSSPELTAAKTTWQEKFKKREPAFLPSGSQVVPLSWSPADAELEAARKMSLVDIANIFNLDSYWLGAPAASMTYQSPGPMYLNLLRVTLEPILSDVEGVWSQLWLPRGHTVRFDRLELLRDDLSTTVTAIAAAIAADLMDVDEGRAYLGLPPRQSTEGAPA